MKGNEHRRKKGWNHTMWVVSLLIGGALTLAWFGEHPDDPNISMIPAASLHALGELDCLSEVSPDARPEDTAALRQELDRVLRVGTLNREVLDKLHEDQRWTDPALHQGLESAVADTIAMIEDADATADCLEDTLASQTPVD